MALELTSTILVTSHMDFVNELARIIDQRLLTEQQQSYVSRLNASGFNRIVQKCGEEACEVVIAAKDLYAAGGDDEHLRQQMLAESADLFFHHLILLRKLGLSFDQVVQELQSRARQEEG